MSTSIVTANLMGSRPSEVLWEDFLPDIETDPCTYIKTDSKEELSTYCFNVKQMLCNIPPRWQGSPYTLYAIALGSP